MNIILVLWLAVAALAADTPLYPASLTCRKDGEIKFIDMGKTSVEQADFCFSADHSYFLAGVCYRETKCQALTVDLATIGKAALAGKVGSPGFKLCRQAGGRPELLQYSDGQAWWSADRCFFPADSSFIDTGILLRRWDRQKKP